MNAPIDNLLIQQHYMIEQLRIVVSDLLLLVEARESAGSTAAVVEARRDAVTTLRAQGWTVPRIRVAFGLSDSTRLARPVKAKPKREPKPPKAPTVKRLVPCESCEKPIAKRKRDAGKPTLCRPCWDAAHRRKEDPNDYRRDTCACGAVKLNYSARCRACEIAARRLRLLATK